MHTVVVSAANQTLLDQILQALEDAGLSVTIEGFLSFCTEV